jgi:hypothetical protein
MQPDYIKIVASSPDSENNVRIQDHIIDLLEKEYKVLAYNKEDNSCYVYEKTLEVDESMKEIALKEGNIKINRREYAAISWRTDS